MIKYLSRNSEETKMIGERLGNFLRSRDVVCLFGDLGAGKTTFVKGIAQALGIPDRDIASASFTIVAEYHNEVPFYHIDLYRIEEGSGIDDTGIWDYIYSEGISVVEWAERLGKIPDEFIRVKFDIIDENARDITIEGIDEEDWNHI